MNFDFVEFFCCIFLHGCYFLVLAFIYLLVFLFSYLKSITSFFCTTNNNLSQQCPIKCYLILFFFLIILRIGSSQPEVFRKRVLWYFDIVLRETLWRALVIFFSSFFIIIIKDFLRILLKSLITPFEIVTYSEVYNSW